MILFIIRSNRKLLVNKSNTSVSLVRKPWVCSSSVRHLTHDLTLVRSLINVICALLVGQNFIIILIQFKSLLHKHTLFLCKDIHEWNDINRKACKVFRIYYLNAHTCQVSRFRRESHGFGNEIKVSRWLHNFSRISIITKNTK